MKKSFRIGYYRYHEDNIFNEHIAFIEKNKDIVDEIALFAEYSHRGYWELEDQKKLAKTLKLRISEYKKAGIKSVGINILDTVGHLDEAWDILENPPMQTMIDISGRQSLSCLCPNTIEYRRYIKERYEILAGSNPDFIWVDDDVRIFGHLVYEPCFCPTCIEKFNNLTGNSYTFATLSSEIQNNRSGETSNKWHKFWVDNYAELCSLIKDTVASVDPDIKLGLMTIQYETYSEWLNALGAVKGRPGGGYYEDFLPRDILRKFLSCEEQLTHYPKEISDRQYEYEIFPYQEMGKSEKITKLEAAFAIMSGCNGIAFNANFLYDNQPLMDIIRKRGKYWDMISSRAENSVSCGIYCSEYEQSGVRLLDIGLPITSDPQEASVFILTGNTPDKYSDEELIKILSKGVFLDTTALDILTQRGFEKYIGAKIEKHFNNGVMERFSDNELNGEYKGFIRNAWMNFDGSKPNASVISLIDDSAEVISDLINIKKDYIGPCMSIYTNELGGRVCSCGYFFPAFVQYNAKRVQLLNIFDSLSEKGISVRINKNHKIIPVMRINKDGEYILMLANMSFDDSKKFCVDIKTNSEKCMKIEYDGTLTDLCPTKTKTGIKLEFENIKPFEEIFITNF